ncbi:MAG: hypothetical protein ACJA2N_001910 [Salibacteraceae bacterium]|jgi:hypothetical protein
MKFKLIMEKSEFGALEQVVLIISTAHLKEDFSLRCTPVKMTAWGWVSIPLQLALAKVLKLYGTNQHSCMSFRPKGEIFLQFYTKRKSEEMGLSHFNCVIVKL